MSGIFNKKTLKNILNSFVQEIKSNFMFIRFKIEGTKEFYIYYLFKENKVIQGINYKILTVATYQEILNSQRTKLNKSSDATSFTLDNTDTNDDIDIIAEQIIGLANRISIYAASYNHKMMVEISPMRDYKFKILSDDGKVLNENSFLQYCSENQLIIHKERLIDYTVLENVSIGNVSKKSKEALVDRELKRLTILVVFRDPQNDAQLMNPIEMEYIPIRNEYYANPAQEDCISILHREFLSNQVITSDKDYISAGYCNFTEVEQTIKDRYEALISITKEKFKLDKIKVRVTLKYNYKDEQIKEWTNDAK